MKKHKKKYKEKVYNTLFFYSIIEGLYYLSPEIEDEELLILSQQAYIEPVIEDEKCNN